MVIIKEGVSDICCKLTNNVVDRINIGLHLW